MVGVSYDLMALDSQARNACAVIFTLFVYCLQCVVGIVCSVGKVINQMAMLKINTGKVGEAFGSNV